MPHPLFVVNSYLITPTFLVDIRIKSESQQVKAYELRAYDNISFKTAFPQAIIEISAIEKSSFDCEKHVRLGGNKV
jgi:hypothetical protein